MDWTIVSILVFAAVIVLFALVKIFKRFWRSERAFAKHLKVDRESKEADFPD